jgi:hypothetical protein
MKQVLVAGASGALGTMIVAACQRLLGAEVHVIAGDYREARGRESAAQLGVGFRLMDIRDEAGTRQAIDGIDLVIVAAGQREPLVERACMAAGVDCIDVTAFAGLVRQVAALYEANEAATSGAIMMAGFFPGLSGLLLASAIQGFDVVHEAHVALVQSTNARAGASGITDMLKIVAGPVHRADGAPLRGFTQGRRMQQDDRQVTVRRIAHGEQVLLGERLATPHLAYWTRWDNEGFNTAISLLSRAGLLLPLVQALGRDRLARFVRHDPARPEAAWLLAEVHGSIAGAAITKRMALETASDYGSTALVVAALARIALNGLPHRCLLPCEVTTLDEVMAIMDDTRFHLTASDGGGG